MGVVVGALGQIQREREHKDNTINASLLNKV
jgi:hypothetical protein